MSIATILIKYSSQIVSIVQFVEETATKVAAEQQKSPTSSFKLNMAKVLLEDFYSTTNPTVPFDQVWVTAAKVISVVVGWLHEVGVFKKSTTPAAA